MKTIQIIAGSVISLVAIFVFVSRSAWPRLLVVDEISLIILGLAILPWLPIFFIKFKLPGGFEAEADRQQGKTDSPAPPAQPTKELQSQKPSVISLSDLNSEAKKIIRTLWKYQQELFHDKPEARWTFAVFHNADVYASYTIGLGQLLELGLVSLAKNQTSAQCMLTNEGMTFCKDNTKNIDAFPTYYKF